MASTTVSKVILTSTAELLISPTFSLYRRRSISVSASRYPRIAANPPDLIGWVNREGGFVHPKLRISEESADGMTLIASEEIPKGSRLVALPERLTLRIKPEDGADGLDSPLSQLVRRVPETILHVSKFLGTCNRGTVGYETGAEASSRTSQNRFFLVAIYKQLTRNLQHTHFLPGRRHKKPTVRSSHSSGFEKDVKSILDGLEAGDHPFCGQDVNASSLGWAMSAVSSRAFCTDVSMLLPLIDMCNHSFSPNAQIIQEKNKQKFLVEVVSGTLIQKDSPVTLNYGNLTNDLLLLDYGFVVSSNPHDHVELAYDGGLLDAAATAAGVSLPRFSSPNEWQIEILSHLHLHGNGASLKVNLGGQEKVNGRLLAALRVVLSKDPEASKKSTLTSLQSLSTEAPLGISVEIGALRTIIALCVICLQHFPTTIMDDESIIKKDISESMKLSVQFRLQKKLMIIDLMQELTRKVKVLLSRESLASQS